MSQYFWCKMKRQIYGKILLRCVMTYLFLVLSDQNILVVDDHSLQEVLGARHILRAQSLLILLLLLASLGELQSLSAGDGRLRVDLLHRNGWWYTYLGGDMHDAIGGDLSFWGVHVWTIILLMWLRLPLRRCLVDHYLLRWQRVRSEDLSPFNVWRWVNRIALNTVSSFSILLDRADL